MHRGITGYGQDGPLRDRSGHDLNYLGLVGMLGLTGEAGGPPVQSAGQIADIGGGSLMAAFGILAALRERDRSGEGQFVDVSMAGSRRSSRARTRAEWAAFASEVDCCVEPVLGLDEALGSELVRAREMVVELDQPGVRRPVQVLGTPVRLSRTPARPAGAAAPALGEHTREVLLGLGYTEDRWRRCWRLGRSRAPGRGTRGVGPRLRRRQRSRPGRPRISMLEPEPAMPALRASPCAR